MSDVFARARTAAPEKLSRATARGWKTAAQPAPAAAIGLLGEVLARLPGIKQPLVQIVAASAETESMQAGRALARSAAEHYGRTLLISSARAAFQDQSVRGLSWLMQELHAEVPNSIVPDSTVSGLYHARVGRDHQPARSLNGWFAEPPGFSMLVVVSPAVATDPRTIDAAIECHGSIMAVTAGVTCAEQVLSATRQLTCAGARLLGTVLLGAPDLEIGFPQLRLAG